MSQSAKKWIQNHSKIENKTLRRIINSAQTLKRLLSALILKKVCGNTERYKLILTCNDLNKLGCHHEQKTHMRVQHSHACKCPGRWRLQSKIRLLRDLRKSYKGKSKLIILYEREHVYWNNTTHYILNEHAFYGIKSVFSMAVADQIKTCWTTWGIIIGGTSMWNFSFPSLVVSDVHGAMKCPGENDRGWSPCKGQIMVNSFGIVKHECIEPHY